MKPIRVFLKIWSNKRNRYIRNEIPSDKSGYVNAGRLIEKGYIVTGVYTYPSLNEVEIYVERKGGRQ